MAKCNTQSGIWSTWLVPDPEVVMQEVWRILRPKGRLVVGFIARNGPWGRKYLMRGMEDPTSVYHSAHFYSATEAASLGWTKPNAVKFGLYVGPDEFANERSAQDMETLLASAAPEGQAGFFGMRWDK